MFASITCPACRHKFTIPEGAMGSRHNCPNCKTPFIAGKSVPDKSLPEAKEASVPMKYEPAPQPAGINKTMLGETEPPIRYNCPRCKKPLESPAIEAGTKKPCPSCGQRLQVPAPPPPPPGLNKTILASNEGNVLPTAVAPGAPASLPMGTVAASPVPVAPAPAAAAPSFSKPIALIAGVLAGGIFLLLCTCLLVVLLSGPSAADREKMALAQKQVADAQKELEELKRSIAAREAAVAQQKLIEDKFADMMRQIKDREDRAIRQAELDREAYRNDQQKAAQAKQAADQKQRELDDEKLKTLKQEQAARDALAKVQAELDALKQRQTQATTVVAQPPVVYSYPLYHPYRYWSPWW
jgi:DNA-directed RNA polymerase subunit RPC12/RpoP